MIQQPVPIGVGGDVGTFVGIGEQVEDLRHPQLGEWFGPDLQGARLALLLKDKLPVVVAQAHQIAVVGEVEELPPGALLGFALPIVKLVVTIQVDMEVFVAHLVALHQLVFDRRFAGGGQQRRQPIKVADQAREIDAGGDVTRPTHQGRYPKSPFPIGVFLTAEGGGAGIGPAVDVGAVVGAVHHDRVFADAQLIN